MNKLSDKELFGQLEDNVWDIVLGSTMMNEEETGLAPFFKEMKRRFPELDDGRSYESDESDNDVEEEDGDEEDEDNKDKQKRRRINRGGDQPESEGEGQQGEPMSLYLARQHFKQGLP